MRSLGPDARRIRLPMSPLRRGRPASITAIALSLGLLAGPALADLASNHAGVVKRAVGTVEVVRDGQRMMLTPGAYVLGGDRVVTGADGGVGIVLADDSMLSAGPSSELQITRMQFDPTTQDGNILLQIARGAMHYVSGLIAKRTPEQVRIETPTVVMGVRGTEIIVDASPQPR